MAFGPEASVTNRYPLPGATPSVRLGPYTDDDAAPHFPFPEDDAAVRFTGVHVPSLLSRRLPDRFMDARVRSEEVLAWGVWRGEELLGHVDVVQAGPNEISLSAILFPGARLRGIGSLLLGGITEVVFYPGVVAPRMRHFYGDVWAIRTCIHPKNTVSRVVARNFGFIPVGRWSQSYEQDGQIRKYPWIRHILPAQGQAIGLDIHIGRERHAARQRNRSMANLQVQLVDPLYSEATRDE